MPGLIGFGRTTSANGRQKQQTLMASRENRCTVQQTVSDLHHLISTKAPVVGVGSVACPSHLQHQCVQPGVLHRINATRR